MNITQQVAASIGTALFSVILTNEIKDKDSLAVAGAAGDETKLAQVLESLGLSPDQVPALLAQVPADMADAFALTFTVGTILVGCCLIPALFLPRKPAEKPVEPAVLVGH